MFEPGFTPTPSLPPQGGGGKPRRCGHSLRFFWLFLFSAILLAGGPPGRAEKFQPARPGRVFKFPRDHGAHPEFKTEWWYWTGHLRSMEGESFGYQLTFFRVALRQPDARARSAWSLHTIYFAHLALTDAGRRTFVFREKAGRGALGLSGAGTGTLKVWIDSWQAEEKGGAYHLTAGDEGLALSLSLTPLKPPALHGDGGFSRKSGKGDAASYYYSISRLDTRGHLSLGGRVLPVSGASWMDHEFFTGSLAPGQVGWDWFALQLADGVEVMLYLLRHQDGSLDSASSGTLIDPQGKARHLRGADFQVKATGTWKSPHTTAVYPSGWEVTIPGAGYRLKITPTLPDQEVRAGGPARLNYWEGQVQVHGHKNQVPINGQGYAELTGYAGSMGGWF